MHETLAEIGEKEILNRLRCFMPLGQIDDDTAEIKTNKNKLLINTDVLVEDVHFSKETTSPEDVGWKAVTTNFSDLASSGTEKILGITVGLVVPPDTSWEWVKRLYQGIDKALKQFGGELLGGDCSKGQQKLIAITAIGTLGPLRLHRSNALPGDHLVTSGPHGLSRLGLALLVSDPILQSEFLDDTLQKLAIKTHQQPIAPLAALRALEKCKPKDTPWRAAGTDSSDGLLIAIENICLSSGCQAVLSLSSMPRSQDWPQGSHWDEWCLNGGEDYELVISLPPEWAKAFRETWPTSKTIGTIRSGPPKTIWETGKEVKILPCSGFKHF